jgi:asparagine synthase (glutamine-hydrolysing)
MLVVEEALGRIVDFRQPGRCLPDRRRLDRYAKALAPDFFDVGGFEPVMEHPFRGHLKNRTWQDLTRETVPCCLRAEDRHGAAFGLDNILPFLDHRLVEFMFRIPGTLKYRDGVTKHLLREATRGILPDATRTRVKKTGWNAPAHVWFSGAGRTALLDLVHSQRFRERGIYDTNELRRLLDEHEQIVASGELREHHMMFLWQLVNLELWLQDVEKAGAEVGTAA